MSDTATIRKVTGGYVVTVRWPIAGTPLGGGEMVCATFDEAITALHRHLHRETKMTDVEWTTKPPTEPGWYWCRHRAFRYPTCGRVFGVTEDESVATWTPFCREGGDWTNDIEWYPIPIPEPPTEGVGK